MKRLLMMGTVLAVLGLATVAFGWAVTSAQEGDGPIGTFLAKVAEKLGVSEEELNTAVQEAQIETIDEAVAEGRLTEKQAAQLKERVQEGGFLVPFRGPGYGRGGLRGVIPEAAAQVLGITEDELRQELRDGNSLAEVAEAKGKNVEDFKAALLTQVRSQLDAQVADGTLTQKQADGMFQRIEGAIDRIVNAEGCPGGFRGRGLGPGRFGGPWYGPPSDEAPESTETTGTTA